MFREKASRLYCGLSCKINHYPHDGHQTLPQKQEQTTKAEDEEEEEAEEKKKKETNKQLILNKK